MTLPTASRPIAPSRNRSPFLDMVGASTEVGHEVPRRGYNRNRRHAGALSRSRNASLRRRVTYRRRRFGGSGTIAVTHTQSAKLWELPAATSLARLWRDRGHHAEAHNLLAPIHDWFTEGFDTPVLQDAKALLDQLA